MEFKEAETRAERALKINPSYVPALCLMSDVHWFTGETDASLKLLARAKTVNPRDESTHLGPLISEDEAVRIERWIAEARAAGARVLCGGNRNGAFVDATLPENVPRDAAIYAREAFGPVAVLAPYRDFDEALALVNESAFGLQAGVFTRDLSKAERPWEQLEVGGVIIGDAPAWRVSG